MRAGVCTTNKQTDTHGHAHTHTNPSIYIHILQSQTGVLICNNIPPKKTLVKNKYHLYAQKTKNERKKNKSCQFPWQSNTISGKTLHGMPTIIRITHLTRVRNPCVMVCQFIYSERKKCLIIAFYLASIVCESSLFSKNGRRMNRTEKKMFKSRYSNIVDHNKPVFASVLRSYCENVTDGACGSMRRKY